MKTSDMLIMLLIIAVIAFGLYWIIASSTANRQVETETENSSLEIKVDDNIPVPFQNNATSSVTN